MNKLRSWIWHRLIYLADRISPDDAFRYTGMSMSLRKGKGWTLNDRGDGSGVQIWYKGAKHYAEHSHDHYEEEVNNG